MRQGTPLAIKYQQYVQDFNELCVTAAQEQGKAVTGESDHLKDTIEECTLMQIAIREIATEYDEPIRSLLERIAELGMMVAERPKGVSGKSFFEEVQATCQELGFEAIPQDV